MEIFHKGEKELQHRLGSNVDKRKARQIILDRLLPQAVNFIENRDCSYLSIMDNDGSLWMYPIIGEGSVNVISLTQMHIELNELLLEVQDLLNTTQIPMLGCYL